MLPGRYPIRDRDATLAKIPFHREDDSGLLGWDCEHSYILSAIICLIELGILPPSRITQRALRCSHKNLRGQRRPDTA